MKDDLEQELFVILRDKYKGYQSLAVAASPHRQWVEARLAKLPADLRDQLRVRPIRLRDVDEHIVVFYDLWNVGGDWELTGFGVDPADRPKLPIEPADSRSDTLMLNVVPEDIFGVQKKLPALRRERAPATEAIAAPLPRRYTLSLCLALLAWVGVLAALMLAVKTRPVYLGVESELPEGLRFPIAYQQSEWVEHVGWHYIEGVLPGAARERTHDQVRWQVIGEDEPVTMRRPRLLNASAHRLTETNFIYGQGNVDAWREQNFVIVTDGYVSRWDDGSVLVFDLKSDRVYGRLSAEVAHELFGG